MGPDKPNRLDAVRAKNVCRLDVSERAWAVEKKIIKHQIKRTLQAASSPSRERWRGSSQASCRALCSASLMVLIVGDPPS